MAKASGDGVAATPIILAKQSSEQGGSGQGDAPPPPYSEPSIPHQTLLPPQIQTQPSYSGQIESSPIPRSDGWIPPPNLAVARSRALRRFWMAFFWAWLIWIAIGMVIGGGVSDVGSSPVGRRGHWDKNGRWRED